jgi:hypothetical protein
LAFQGQRGDAVVRPARYDGHLRNYKPFSDAGFARTQTEFSQQRRQAHYRLTGLNPEAGLSCLSPTLVGLLITSHSGNIDDQVISDSCRDARVY